MSRPFVSINMASTVDGKITSAAREEPGFASKADRLRMDRIRAEHDAILVGAGTMRADNPKLYVRDESMRAYRRSLGKPDALTRVMLSRSLRLEGTSRFFEDRLAGERIVVTTRSAGEERAAALDERAELWRLGDDDVDLAATLERLAGRGVERLLVEGGAEVNWAFLEADLVDELYLTIAPALLGGRDAPTIVGGDGFPMERQRRLRLLSLEREGDELFTRWAVRRQDP